MPDKVLNIKLTEREIDLLHQCISTNMETVKRRHDTSDPMIAELLTELGDLSIDLLEQQARPGDWTESAESDQTVICDAETRMFNAGVEAREKMKASSRAADRRRVRSFGEFEVDGPDRKLSDQQLVDLWNPNDPTNW